MLHRNIVNNPLPDLDHDRPIKLLVDQLQESGIGYLPHGVFVLTQLRFKEHLADDDLEDPLGNGNDY